VLRVPSSVWEQTLETFRRCGASERECVVYWTGPATQASLVDRAVHPTHRATAFSYQVDNTWVHKFWSDLASEARSIRAQVHTHAGHACHSPTDDKWPIVGTPGFLSLVVPSFAIHPVRREQLYIAVLSETGWCEGDLSEEIVGLL
jgi:hypothetical protein